jgi:hypothetical protein
MMQDNSPINFYIKHFFINCQIKKLQLIFDTFVPPCIKMNRRSLVSLKLKNGLTDLNISFFLFALIQGWFKKKKKMEVFM